jgi:tetratricopeptide (TPR) repeat protein
MSRRDDLEQRIREAYDIIREYEEIAQVSDRPEEIQRARRQIEEQWSRVRDPLVQYLAICRRRGLDVPEDIAEVAAIFGPELEKAVATYRPSLLPLPTGKGWIYGVVAGAVLLLVATTVLLTQLLGPAATPEPSLTPTPLPPTETTTETATPTVTGTPAPPSPTPTATPIFSQGALYRVAIAEFDSQKASRQIEIVRRLEDDLRANLDAAGLRESVDVRVVPNVIGTEYQARDFATELESDVLIWGWYDDLGIRLYVLLGEGAETGAAASSHVTGLSELPLSAVNETSELSFYVHDVLPSNTTFLSMYVIGHLYYLSNNYAEGYKAFDAAMANIPETVALENEALPHFFNARLMQTTTYTDPTEIVCEYARAIELDPELFEAYNNLAVLMMTVCEFDGYGCTDIYDYHYDVCYDTTAYEQLPCVEAARIPSLEPADLIGYALQIRPDWALARFNLAALHWNTTTNGMSEIIPRHVEEFETVVVLDPTIAGAQIFLGNMAVWDGDFDLAAERFSTAMNLWPASPEVAVNMGQALALAGRDEKAIDAYHQALALTDEGSAAYREAHLALGNLYHRRGDLGRALQHYQLLELTGGDYAFDNTLTFALAKAEIDSGAWFSATERLYSDLHVGGLREYVLCLMAHIREDLAEIDVELGQPICIGYLCAWTSGDVEKMTWCDLWDECVVSVPEPLSDPAMWGSEGNPCLPRDMRERLKAVYEIFQRRVHHRLFFQSTIGPEIGACPYVFTYDSRDDAWFPDTTILYHLIGPESEQLQARPLARFDGRLWLREVEPETSYVDQLYVRVLTGNGGWLVLTPDDPALAADDGDYLILHQGDGRYLTFDLPPNTLPIQQAWVVAEGYYVPYGEEE